MRSLQSLAEGALSVEEAENQRRSVPMLPPGSCCFLKREKPFRILGSASCLSEVSTNPLGERPISRVTRVIAEVSWSRRHPRSAETLVGQKLTAR